MSETQAADAWTRTSGGASGGTITVVFRDGVMVAAFSGTPTGRPQPGCAARKASS